LPNAHPPGSTRFAGYPSAFVYDAPRGKKRAVQHLLWGDWLRVTGEPSGSYIPVRARGEDGWMHADEVGAHRLLEIATFEAGILTHPDQDHYGGFGDIFLDPFVRFETLYHNGIMERYGTRALGATRKRGGRTYLTSLVRSLEQLRSFLARKSNWQNPTGARRNEKQYAAMLDLGVRNESFGEFRALSVGDGFVPGYGAGQPLSLQVLGPVTEPPDPSNGMLRTLGSDAKTKNGHSIVLRLLYRSVSVFLGGDLNTTSQELLLEHHTGLDPRPRSVEAYEALVTAARRVFQVDVAKACHHGAADLSTKFLAALNPVATVISSGDDEPHSHPRADALGATGLHSRGTRPLIFSTELARSHRDVMKRPEVLRNRLKELRAEIPLAPEGSALQKRLIREFDKAVDGLERSVAVYGTIQLRSDGHRVVLAQKLERPRGSTKWDLYRLEPQGTQGPLRHLSTYED
jgi:beta-lactamase superfamily II metal-dependent hydrolase